MEHKIPLDETSRILIEKSNYTLQRKIETKKGEFRWITEGYFPTLLSCINSYICEAPTASSSLLHDLKEVIETIKQAELRIEHLICGTPLKSQTIQEKINDLTGQLNREKRKKIKSK